MHLRRGAEENHDKHFEIHKIRKAANIMELERTEVEEERRRNGERRNIEKIGKEYEKPEKERINLYCNI